MNKNLRILTFSALSMCLSTLGFAQSAPPPVTSVYDIVIDYNDVDGVIAPVHGVNGGPVIDANPLKPNAWDIYAAWMDTSQPLWELKIETLHTAGKADYTAGTNRYVQANIPYVRLHGTAATDMMHIWIPSMRILTNGVSQQGYLPPGDQYVPDGGLLIDATAGSSGDVEISQRLYSGQDADLASNYEWAVFDESIQSVLDVGAVPIIRLGHAPYKYGPGHPTEPEGKIIPGGNFRPDDPEVFAEVSREIVLRLRQMISNDLEYGEPMPIIYVELWNEPYFENFWFDESTPGVQKDPETKAQDYFDLYVDCIKVFYENVNAPFNPAKVVLVPQIPAALTPASGAGSEPYRWQQKFLDLCKINGRRPAVVAPHVYSFHPGAAEQRLSDLDADFLSFWPPPVGQLPGVTELLITEWNRSGAITGEFERMAWRPGAVPYLVNNLIQFNDSYNDTGKSTRVIGANLFSAQIHVWTPIENPIPSGAAPNLALSSGLVLDVYGKRMYGETPNRLHIESGRFQDNDPLTADLGAYRDFDVIAGKSNDGALIHILTSSFMALDYPGKDMVFPQYSGGTAPILAEGLPADHAVSYTLNNLPSNITSIDVERFAEANSTSAAAFLPQFGPGPPVGSGANLISIQGPTSVPVVNGVATFTVQGMLQNSYEFFTIVETP